MLAVISTPRSGTTFLCNALKRSGVGDIREYLNFDLQDQAEHFEAKGSKEWLQCLRRHGGIKIFKETTILIELELRVHWLKFLNEHLDAVIYLERKDTVDQALSRWIAQHTRIWHVYNAEQEQRQALLSKQCPYRFNQIYYFWVRFHAEKEFWRQNLDQITPPVLRIDYERMLADPVVAISDCLQFLDHDPGQLKLPDQLKPAAPKPKELREQFLEDMENRFGPDAFANPVEHLSVSAKPSPH
jgi:LPS sulfotransferase NodH